MSTDPDGGADRAPLDPISLAQAKALAHPVRRRMLAAFREGARSLAEVASAIGEPEARLVRHREVLEEAELIRPTGLASRQRGVVPTYEARTREMIAPLAEDPTHVADVFQGALRAGHEEVGRSLDAERLGEADDDLFLSVNTVVHPGEDALRELTHFVVDWVRRNRDAASGEPPSHLTLATFPMRQRGES